MPVLEHAAHEDFAQARFSGKPLVEAHYAAGYAGDKASAFKLAQLFEIKERIAELYREAAAETVYEKTHAVRDLLAIIHACPAEAEDDHPLCEVRIGKDGPYHRFPPKLQAMARLIKLMGWDKPVKVEVDLKDNFENMLAEIRRRPRDNPSPVEDPEPVEAVEDPEPVEGPCSSGSQPSTTLSPVTGVCDPGPEPAADPVAGVSDPGPQLTARQERFANARATGLGVMEAYRAAGYSGDTPNLAWRLNSMPAVKARIAEFNGAVETAISYRKDDAIRDLVAIIRARPSQAGPDHPLCEMRQSHWGPYHRFPSKLAAITLLAKMLGWHEAVQLRVDHDPDAGFKQVAEFLRHRS